MRLINVSNRLPVNLSYKDGKISIQQSIGGLATGLNAFIQKNYLSNAKQLIWLGWPGVSLEKSQENEVTQKLRTINCEPVFIPKDIQEKFNNGFCNGMLWPIFHYANLFNSYNEDEWQNYIQVNQLFCKKIIELWQPGDIIWLHDYHLLLLAKFLRDFCPDLTIGFFLHIPFPHFEALQTLPQKCRESILEGMLSADVIGFHIPEYYQHFISAIEKVFGHKNILNSINFKGRKVKFDAYPMGIDYENIRKLAENSKKDKYIQKIIQDDEVKIMFSIDRLDYTKGIPNRLRGFEEFLLQNPDWHRRVVLMLIVAPSRESVKQYRILKKEIEKLVGRINGRFSDMVWQPIHYQYKALTQEELIKHYAISNVCLVTPLRDGMNLIAKEYVAARIHTNGVLILSETAGAAQELKEAIIINPHCPLEIAKAIKQALTMSQAEQRSSMEVMQTQLKHFNINHWGQRFLNDLFNSQHQTKTAHDSPLKFNPTHKLIPSYQAANKRIIFLDYDGTLVPLFNHPSLASPQQDLLGLLQMISANPQNKLVIVSGRDKNILEKWLGLLNIDLVAEHGAWFKHKDQPWKIPQDLKIGWKDEVRNLFKNWSTLLPGSFLEEKDFSLAWHYRNVDENKGDLFVDDIINTLKPIIENYALRIIKGHKVVEVVCGKIGKDYATKIFVNSFNHYDFIMAIGDDETDEDMFKTLPENAFSIRVGKKQTAARFVLENQTEVINILNFLADAEALFGLKRQCLLKKPHPRRIEHFVREGSERLRTKE